MDYTKQTVAWLRRECNTVRGFGLINLGSYKKAELVECLERSDRGQSSVVNVGDSQNSAAPFLR